MEKLVAYVSDERYLAVEGAVLEFEQDERSIEGHSRATGAVYADLEPGTYRVTVRKDGYGPKRLTLTLPGTETTDIRLLSDRLVGYMWPKWVVSGETAEHRVNSIESYRLELFRYGAEPEFIRTLGWIDEHAPRATQQITPDGDYTQTGVGFNKVGYGNNPHHSMLVTAPDRSGLYYIRATTESGEYFSFPWIVAPSQPTARVAVLASNITWNAYNNFGGRSNYIHPQGLPSTPTIFARQELARYQSDAPVQFSIDDYPPLSFERPELFNSIPADVRLTDPVAGRLECHAAPAEWRLLGWLEREGIDYDYYAEPQLHFGPLDLNDYDVLMISVHPEYWSVDMYDKLKSWVFDGGGKLMYLGGNGINCAVEFIDEGTMTVRNGRFGGSVGLWDKIGKESRFHLYHEPEAALLGVRTTETGIMTGAPYRVLDASHWAFEGTGLAEGNTFGELCLHERCSGGASGHETDKVSPSTPAGATVLAKGLNPDDGGAEIVYFETPSGGAVFSVGSINYPCSLPVDPDISQITRNVIEQFLKGDS